MHPCLKLVSHVWNIHVVHAERGVRLFIDFCVSQSIVKCGVCQVRKRAVVLVDLDSMIYCMQRTKDH